jgi:hypothetical protein
MLQRKQNLILIQYVRMWICAIQPLPSHIMVIVNTGRYFVIYIISHYIKTLLIKTAGNAISPYHDFHIIDQSIQEKYKDKFPTHNVSFTKKVYLHT